ncbi:MAG: LamG domain-containing protein, partial [Pseudomonadota bacterium]
QQQLVFNQTDPLNNGVDGSFYLEPGQEVLVTFRVLPDPEADTPADPATTFVSDDLGGLVSAQPLNTDPNTDPPADQFGPPANTVPGTAGGTTIGGGGTPPVNGGTFAAGEQVSITATGFVQRGAGFPIDTPDGSGACSANCLAPTVTALSLVARIGGGPWQFVGTGPTVLTATTAGDLEFGVNDNFFNDNTGAFYVTATLVVNPPPATPVSLWSGEGNALDSIGSNDGTLFGGTTFDTGRVNQSFVFDGSNDYMDIGQPLSEAEGTVVFWVRRNGPLTAGSDVFFGSVGNNLQRTPTLFVRTGETLLWEFNNVTVQNSGVSINAGEWYHLAMTWQPSGANTQVQVYVDGTLVDSGTSATPADFQANVLVGAYRDRSVVNQYANASIDEVAVYDSALTSTEVQDLYNAAPPITTVTITSITPSTGGNSGPSSGMLVARGANLPPPSGSTAVISNGTTTANGFIFQSPSTTSAYWVRLPTGFPTGPATLQIQNGALTSNAFPITVSTAHGTPVITNILDAGTVPTTSTSSGDIVYVQADGIDTTGWVIRFTQGSNSWTVTPDSNNFATSSDALGLTARVIVPGGLVTGSVDVDVSQGGSGFSSSVTLTVP